MASNILQKYIWLTEKVYQKGRVTFNELNELWQASDLSGGAKLSKRTFHKWQTGIQETLGLTIENENKGHYCYYIKNPQLLEGNGLIGWAIREMHLTDVLLHYADLQGQILLDKDKGDTAALETVLEAMRQKHRLQFKTSGGDEAESVRMEPYGVLLRDGQWLVTGKTEGEEAVRTMPISGMSELKITEESFKRPAKASLKAAFGEVETVKPQEEGKAEKVEVRMSETLYKYLLSHPLHESQQLKSMDDDEYIMQYELQPTAGFLRTLLSYCPDAEVMSPKWLRQEMAERVKKLNKRLKKDKGKK